MDRRKFLTALMSGGTALVTANAWPRMVESNGLAVEQVRVSLPRLPVRWNGLRLVQLSDLHLCQYTTQDDIARAVDVAMRQQPQMIVLTGDFVWGKRRWTPGLVDPLRRLAAPLGVFAILGNHDHWLGAENVTDALQAAGVTVLRNEAVSLATGDQALWLVGVDDVTVERDNLARALHGVPSDQCTLLLVHEPDFADQVAAYPADRQLSGHSHGGQVRLPLVGPVMLPELAKKYPAGLYRINQTMLYTNRGIGVIPPPVRLFCRPEVTVLTLHADSEGDSG